MRWQNNQHGQNRSPALASVSSISNQDSFLVISQISAITSEPSEIESLSPEIQANPVTITSSVSGCARQGPPIKLQHHIFSSGEWKRARLLDHPSMPLSLSVCMTDYASFDQEHPKVNKVAVQDELDSCAQSCLWSLSDCLKAGFKVEDLMPVSLSLSAAYKSSIEITGALFARLEGVSNNDKYLVLPWCAADNFYLSLEAMLNMGLINRDSPLCVFSTVSTSGSNPFSSHIDRDKCHRPTSLPPNTRST